MRLQKENWAGGAKKCQEKDYKDKGKVAKNNPQRVKQPKWKTETGSPKDSKDKGKTMGSNQRRIVKQQKEKEKRKRRNKKYSKCRKKCGIYERYIKRALDFTCAFFGILFLWPVMLAVAVLVRKKLGSPVIFTQERPGLHEKVFKLYKFRSMSDARDNDGNLLPDGERLGKFGKALRATSLDELPELLNILKGDMSVVGPRPLLVEYLPRYSKRQHKRHNVRPGLTGYAQVHGRNAVSWEERLEQDVWYVGHITFFRDLGILLRTVRMVLKKQGISSETCATMEEFKGDGMF